MQKQATIKVTLQNIRRLAITKQHLDNVIKPKILDLIKGLGCIQLDPISTVEQSHLLVLWSRLENFDRGILEDLRWNKKVLFEYLAHAASIVPVEKYPVFANTMEWNQNDSKQKAKIDNWLSHIPNIDKLKKYILRRLKDEKSVLSRNIKDESLKNGKKSVWWSNRYVPNLIHALWLQGVITVVGRKGKQKCWGLTQDFISKKILNTRWDENKITIFSIQKSLKSLGIATKKQIKNNYTRGRYINFEEVFNQLQVKKLIQEIEVVDLNGVKEEKWYIHKDDISILTKIKNGNFNPKTTLLSPFDNLICDRDRTEILFNFNYRIEIYTKKENRKFGYYVMPILDGDKLIGRVDPVMDRKNKVLTINNIFYESGFKIDKQTKKRLKQSIKKLATFLGAKTIIYS